MAVWAAALPGSPSRAQTVARVAAGPSAVLAWPARQSRWLPRPPGRRSQRDERVSGVSGSWSSSEVQLHAKFRETGRQNRGRNAPAAHRRVAVRRILGEHRVSIERVIEIEADHRADRTRSQHFAETEIELIESIAEQRARLHH